MRTMRNTTMLVLAMLLMMACADEPTYQGRAASEWITLSRDNDAETRESTIRALASFRREHRPAAQRLAEMADSDFHPQVRIMAAHTSHARTEVVIAAYEYAIEDDWNQAIGLEWMERYAFKRELVDHFMLEVCKLLESRLVDDMAAKVITTWLRMYGDEQHIADTLLDCTASHLHRDDHVGRELRDSIQNRR